MSDSQPTNKPTKFPPHTTILSRILHDPTLTPSNYSIGYLDRFSGIQEISVPDWVKAQAEGVTGEDFIPGHRIVFFKKLSPIITSALETEIKERVKKNGDKNEDEEEVLYDSDGEVACMAGVVTRDMMGGGGEEIKERKRKGKDEEEEWDGVLVEDLAWSDWKKRGEAPVVDVEGDGKMEGEIVWDRRRRVDLISRGKVS